MGFFDLFSKGPSKEPQLESKPKLDPAVINVWLILKNPKLKKDMSYDYVSQMYLKINSNPFPYSNISSVADCCTFLYLEYQVKKGKKLQFNSDDTFYISDLNKYEIIADKKLIVKLECLAKKHLNDERKNLLAIEKAGQKFKRDVVITTLSQKCQL